MSNVLEAMETEDADGKSTLVRPVSTMLKDGSSSGPPMLFRHASMQRILHCCQNMNLLPYLLYSFDNSKSHPIAREVHIRLGQLLEVIVARLFFLYKGFRRCMLHGICQDELQPREQSQNRERCCGSQLKLRPVNQQKRGQSNNHRTFLMLAVYFAPLLLAFQLIGIFGLMIFRRYTPGYIFLITALLLLGYISLKILFHQSKGHVDRYKKIKAH